MPALLLALLLALLIPATASADLRAPVVGETSLLSDVFESYTWQPAIATDGNRTFATYMEERTGVMVHAIGAAGTEVGAARALQSYGTVSVEDPRVAVSGEHVYVAWIQGSHALRERHAVVAASHDGGRTWAEPVRAGRPTGHGAWDLRLAADGDTVFVAYADNVNRLWTAGSRDGAKSFTCFATVSEPGDGGHEFDVAVDGQHVFWSWVGRGGDVMVRRSKDAGRTLEPVELVHDSGPTDRTGVPVLAADGGTVAVAFGQRFLLEPEHGQTRIGYEPRVLTSTDQGATWRLNTVGGEATRCILDYCPQYALDVDGGRVYVGWRAQGQMWLARSEDGFTPRALGPYVYTWHTPSAPHLDAHGDSVAAAWHSAPQADSRELDPVAAFSHDHGRTFALRAIDGGAGVDILPVAAAWGPEAQGTGVAWWARDAYDVKFAPMSSVEPDVAVLDVRPHQVTEDAARLVAGRPTTVRAELRSHSVSRRAVTVEIDLAYNRDGERVERSLERRIVLSPGRNTVQLLADAPITVGAGRITARVTVVPGGADSDPANNTGEGSRAVVQPAPLRVLFVPVHADDEAVPSCRDVQDVAEGTERFVEASWPVDPATFSVAGDCAATLVHPAGLTELGLMGEGMLMTRLDRLKWTANVDKVVGVVPKGWFSRQRINGFQDVIGVAPMGGNLEAAIVERQNTGGWIVAHELAHNLGLDHRDATPAPGYWVAEQRDIPRTTRDFMHFTTEGGDVAVPTDRWTSQATWDDLTTTFATAPQPKENLRGSDPFMFAVSGSVAADGAVTLGAGFELEGEAEASSGPYTAELLAGDGTVLDAQGFGAATDLGELSTSVGAFSLRLPQHEGARTLRIRRGDDVLHTRARSAAAPAVKVHTPERAEVGDELKITWEATDADGDALTSLVSISTDGGETWRPLDGPTVKATAALSTADARVRVTTSDGWNTTTAESGRFVIGGELRDGLIAAVTMLGRIHTADLDGGGMKEIAHGHRPRWSPDGRRIAHDDQRDLWVMNADGSGRRKVTSAATGEQYLWGAWAPDGEHVVSLKSWPGGPDNVAVNVATAAERPFPARGEICEFSRDGSRVLSGGQGYWRLSRADGTESVPLPGHITGAGCMSLSPDQRYGVAEGLTFDPNRISDIYLWDLQTGTRRNLTNGAFSRDNKCPRFSPTGEWIVWSSTADGGEDIWKMRPDGTGAVKVIDDEAADGTGFMCADVQPVRGSAPDPAPTLEERDPVAKAVAASGEEGAPIALDATASAPGADDAALTAYAWDTDGDGAYDDATGATPKVSFPDEGTFEVGVLVTDARGRTATATAEVTVANARPVITGAKINDDGMLTASVTDAGATDTLTATVGGDTVPLIAARDGFRIASSRPGGAIVEVDDGDGGSAVVEATRVSAPANSAPTATDGTVTTLVGEAVDIALPATDPEGDALRYEIVTPPTEGALQLRAESLNPSAPDVTYTAGDNEGTVTFTYRVSDGSGTSQVATVTVQVTRTPAPAPAPPVLHERTAEPARPVRRGTKPIDQRVVDQATAVTATDVFTLPSAKACVSRRHFSIRIKRGAYRRVVVHVNGKRVKVRNRAARVDLRGLPKGRFKVKIAVTLKTGKVVKSTRAFRTCTPGNKQKGGRS